MMFNGEETEKMNATEVTDGVIEEFFSEMSQSIRNENAEGMDVVETPAADAVNFLSLKEPENSVLPIENASNIMEEPPNGTTDMLTDSANCAYPSEEESLKNMEMKNVDVSPSWKISLMESNNTEQVDMTNDTPPVSEQQFCQFWECPKCNALFRDKESCELHFQKAHNFTCGLCKEPFEEKELFENHIVNHISETHELQRIDNMKFFSSLPATQNHSEKNDIPVAEDEKNLKIENFDQEKVKEKIFGCSSCNEIFNTEKALTEHEKNHEMLMALNEQEDSNSMSIPDHDEEPVIPKKPSEFICEVCKKVCFSKHSLIFHMKKNHSSVRKAYTCDECGKSFKFKLTLQNHKAKEHQKDKNPRLFSCEVCFKNFSSTQALDRHLLTHDDEDLVDDDEEEEEDVDDGCPFECDFCGGKFKHSADLLHHLKVAHPNCKEFPCSECGKKFKSKSYLEVHIAEVHSVEEKVKCQFCSKSCKSLAALEAHILTHVKRYPCDYCEYTFSSQKELSKHLSTHSHVKNWNCNYCSKVFHKRDNLRAHVRNAHY